ncbi:carboxypeptidase-like regulatory domain-containing protein [Hymenobacter jeollabukensis]|uniref:Carboxypeptidase regulatory-like domain-containing protein n=1 Tax=Hymenobacter jeollabukensis TaxID=2025313 RepID=A0A5R8WWR1_9BACT|nr:carboxypeptidase-like regulatory domain-containing protein [Hymenobacter jeollabukensis]TLM96789.1 carboxypeptidase regulatory-like domain-containing protein [Hymenobacter jeollabukensis]
MLFSLLNRALLSASLLAASVSQPATANLAENPVRPTLQLTGSFTGVLLDQYTGRPLQQATVALMRQDSEQLISGALSAENGEFRLDRASFGHYTLHVEVPGYQPLHETVTLAAGRDLIDLGTYALIPLSATASTKTTTMVALATQP